MYKSGKSVTTRCDEQITQLYRATENNIITKNETQIMDGGYNRLRNKDSGEKD